MATAGGHKSVQRPVPDAYLSGCNDRKGHGFVLRAVIPPGMASATLHRKELADHFIPCPDGFCDCSILGLACQ